MLTLVTVASSPHNRKSATSGVLTLPYEERRKSRMRARLDDGRDVALLLPRGIVLHDGDHLCSEDGTLVHVRAAPETLSIVATKDTHLLMRAAYHLGNRHVALAIKPGQLMYQHDHVLDDLVRSLGLTVTVASAAFDPEGGGYARAHTHHDHAHD